MLEQSQSERSASEIKICRRYNGSQYIPGKKTDKRWYNMALSARAAKGRIVDEEGYESRRCRNSSDIRATRLTVTSTTSCYSACSLAHCLPTWLKD
jgi:hypothetical protein